MSSAIASRFDERQHMLATGYSMDDMPESAFFEGSFPLSAAQLFPECHHGNTSRRFDASHLFFGDSQQQHYVAASCKTAGDAAAAIPLDSSAANAGNQNLSDYSRFVESSHDGSQSSTLAALSPSFVPKNGATPVAHHGTLQNTAEVLPSSISMASEEPPADDFIIDEFDEMLNQLFLFGEDKEIQVQSRPAAVVASSPTFAQAFLAPAPVDVDSTVAAAMNAATSTENVTTTETSSNCATKDMDATGVTGGAKRARKYQAGQWDHRLKELLDFQSQHGHTFVPHSYPPNQKLAQWVKRQRYQHKLKHCGHHSTLSDEREGILNKVSFIWDSHAASWQEQFHLLEQFSQTYGHCNVPTRYQGSTALNVWCKHQRKQYKLFKSQKPCSLNEERLDCLSSIGFNWNPRSKSLA